MSRLRSSLRLQDSRALVMDQRCVCRCTPASVCVCREFDCATRASAAPSPRNVANGDAIYASWNRHSPCVCSVPFCSHDIYLSETTNANEVFPDKNATYSYDDVTKTGVFAPDLTYAQVQKLRMVQPNKLRDPQYNGEFKVRFSKHLELWKAHWLTKRRPAEHAGVLQQKSWCCVCFDAQVQPPSRLQWKGRPAGVHVGCTKLIIADNADNHAHLQLVTLEEYIKVALAADRPVGIYPETKFPEYHDALLSGTTISHIVLGVLTKYGYEGPMGSHAWKKQPVFIQSFEVRAYLAL